jgi:hypothetical protein
MTQHDRWPSLTRFVICGQKQITLHFRGLTEEVHCARVHAEFLHSAQSLILRISSASAKINSTARIGMLRTLEHDCS